MAAFFQEAFGGAGAGARCTGVADATLGGEGVAVLYAAAAEALRVGHAVVLISALHDAQRHLAVLRKMVRGRAA